MRARHVVARQELWRRRESPLLRARRLAVIMNTIAAARRGPDVETVLTPALQGRRWSVERTSLIGHEATKLEAIAQYPSQTRAFGGLAGIERAVRAYDTWWGVAEPLWRAN